jgi:hypothetical protein
MELRLVHGKAIAFRTIVGAGFLGAFLFALVLAAAPQFHERIHQPDGATHQCAVTLLASGNCLHTPVTTISLAPPARPQTLAHISRSFSLVTAHLEFSLLEHAPPAVS